MISQKSKNIKSSESKVQARRGRFCEGEAFEYFLTERNLNSTKRTSELRIFVYLYDGLGNLAFATDEAGKLVSRQRYNEWGEFRERSGQKLLFGYKGELTLKGHPELDSGSSDLVYMRARFYSPTLKRFISRDPLSGTSTDYISQNAYLFAGNDPINNSDPSGEAYEFLLPFMPAAYIHLNIALDYMNRQQTAPTPLVVQSEDANDWISDGNDQSSFEDCQYGESSWVNEGELIGYVGMTVDSSLGGRTTGPHLHIEVQINGARVNPINYFTTEFIYGKVEDALNTCGYGCYSGHNGFDIGTGTNGIGKKVYALHSGIYEKKWTALGNTFFIAGTKFTTVYGHLDRYAN